MAGVTALGRALSALMNLVPEMPVTCLLRDTQDARLSYDYYVGGGFASFSSIRHCAGQSRHPVHMYKKQ